MTLNNVIRGKTTVTRRGLVKLFWLPGRSGGVSDEIWGNPGKQHSEARRRNKRRPSRSFQATDDAADETAEEGAK